ncbi:GH25 family lysozyme [Weissella diestrammenae]|uniref:GH25 family lysozyme n=1 Tax=Weissella diestrammenae TaxID=1162633 RepID=UPI001FAD44DC|nr:GH25 family lysozyme [Weissella diestrammenae]
MAEADYAVAAAQQAGLPVGAVLVADVENANQMAMGSAMQPVVQAFKDEVMRVGGYRSTGYSMASHINVTPDGDKAWVASYPYEPVASQNWFNTEHGWQWTSKAAFASSLGVFDVSQLYDDFFTSGQDVSDKPAPSVPNDSAIQQFKNVGNKFTTNANIRVDAVKFVKGIWQMVNYSLAGAKSDGSDFDWTKNGIPMSLVTRVDGGDNWHTNAGAVVRFNQPMNAGTIDNYDYESNGTGIGYGGFGMVWYDANCLLAA